VRLLLPAPTLLPRVSTGGRPPRTSTGGRPPRTSTGGWRRTRVPPSIEIQRSSDLFQPGSTCSLGAHTSGRAVVPALLASARRSDLVLVVVVLWCCAAGSDRRRVIAIRAPVWCHTALFWCCQPWPGSWAPCYAVYLCFSGWCNLRAVSYPLPLSVFSSDIYICAIC